MSKKTIISEFFTTVSFSQAFQSLYLMTFGSYKLRYGKDKKLFEKEFLEKISPHSVSPKGREVTQKIISFYNGRSAIFHALKIIGVGKEDEVIVNSYNCVSVSNAVIQSGAKIKYSDIEKETLSFDFDILKNNITEKTKVIIIQHTFGKIARDYDKIIKFAQENNILVIEDCAHSLNIQPLHFKEGRVVGDFAIFSTGRDKVISSVTGGFLVINNEKYSPHLTSPKMRGIEGLKMPSIKLVMQNLMYNIAGYKAYFLYDFFKLGRVIIFLSRKLNLITEILTPSEKKCNFDNFNLDFPNSLSCLARKELKKLEKYTENRLENIKYYSEKVSPHLTSPKVRGIEGFLDLDNYNGFRFPILLESEEEKNKLIKFGRENNIIFGNTWSGINLAPVGTNLEEAQYTIGSCPVSEDISKRILVLPNHKNITQKDLERVVEVLNNFK